MEWLFGIGIVWFIFTVLGAIDSNNYDYNSSSSSPGHLEFKINQTSVAIEIKAKGSFPEKSNKKNLKWHTAVFCEDEPVISLVDQYREPNNLFYSLLGPTTYNNNSYYPDWVVIGLVPINGLQGPYKGKKEIEIEMVLFDAALNFPFNEGFCTSQNSIYKIKKFNISYNFTVKGYMELAKDESKTRELSITIMMAVAMSDGHLHDSEGTIIKKYIQQNLEMIKDENKKKEKKSFYNNILKTAHIKFINKNVTFSDIKKTLQDLVNMDDDSINQSTVSLCYDIMAADGKIEKKELEMLEKINNFLDIDENFQKDLHNKKLLSVDLSGVSDENYEKTLGINKELSIEEKKSILNHEFIKWNNRLSIVKEKKEKENVQHMLHMIAKLRIKYES
tara:strand:+ start:1111 stop:2280 length:1170 start_codon:yes stop_codon:yes gene_type:complete